MQGKGVGDRLANVVPQALGGRAVEIALDAAGFHFETGETDAHEFAGRPALYPVVVKQPNGLTASAGKHLHITQPGGDAKAHGDGALVNVVMADQQQIDAVAKQNVFLQGNQRQVGGAAAILVSPDGVVLDQYDEVQFAAGTPQCRFSKIDLQVDQFFGQGEVIDQGSCTADKEMHPTDVKAIVGTAGVGIEVVQ